MKRITKQRLRELIREEIERLLEVNPYHGKDGTFVSKENAKTYSLTKSAEDDVGEESDLEVPARGTLTKTGKVSAKYGMNTSGPEKQCGRKTIQGTGKRKTRSCKDYPKTYWDEG